MDDELKKLISDRESYFQELKRSYLQVNAFLEIINDINKKLEPMISLYFTNDTSEGGTRKYMHMSGLLAEIQLLRTEKEKISSIIELMEHVRYA